MIDFPLVLCYTIARSASRSSLCSVSGALSGRFIAGCGVIGVEVFVVELGLLTVMWHHFYSINNFYSSFMNLELGKWR